MTNYAPFIPYQTEEDKNRQHEMINKLSKLWNFTPEDQGDLAIIDYKCIRNGKLVAFIEIKSKFCNFADYNTYLCTRKDIDEGLLLSRRHNVPFIISVKWNDFWGYLKVDRNDYPYRKSGQMNRNDPNDYNTLCYLIPMSEFKEVKFND
jgi:hypothetical protein